MVTCAKCGSDRLIPLTFVTVRGEDRSDTPRRPVAKCAKCGERTFVTVKAYRTRSPD
jgi:RNase P subunit RPR2